jgi:integrase
MLLRFMADTMAEPESLTQEDVVAYLTNLSAPDRSLMLRALRSYYGWAADRLGVDNPVRGMSPKRLKYGRIESVSADDLTRLLVALAWRHPRRAWVALFLYATGGRIGSIVAVRPQDIWNGEVHFKTAKGGRLYSVPLGHLAQEAVKELLQYGLPTLVGVSAERVRQWLRQAELDCGIKVNPHKLRHTFATRIARATDARTWQELMGHADLSQFRRYVLPDEDRMRAAVEELG